MKPCKHLDYDEASYSPGCTLKTCAPHFPDVRYWRRNNVPHGDAPRKVQFCRLRGRINDIFDCYEPGSMPCWEAPDA